MDRETLLALQRRFPHRYRPQLPSNEMPPPIQRPAVQRGVVDLVNSRSCGMTITQTQLRDQRLGNLAAMAATVPRGSGVAPGTYEGLSIGPEDYTGRGDLPQPVPAEAPAQSAADAEAARRLAEMEPKLKDALAESLWYMQQYALALQDPDFPVPSLEQLQRIFAGTVNLWNKMDEAAFNAEMKLLVELSDHNLNAIDFRNQGAVWPSLNLCLWRSNALMAFVYFGLIRGYRFDAKAASVVIQKAQKLADSLHNVMESDRLLRENIKKSEWQLRWEAWENTARQFWSDLKEKFPEIVKALGIFAGGGGLLLLGLAAVALFGFGRRR